MIYFDNAASTPLDEQVLEAMLPYMREGFGNPSSVHSAGRQAKAAIEKSRVQIAETLHADPREIVFTSGGTESVNAVHKGVAMAHRSRGNHLILSSVEHHCVLECGEWLSRNGFEVTLLPVDSEGFVDPKEVEKAVRKETILISVMAANNEVGTIEPFAQIGKMARERGILFHTDAVQAYGKIPIDVQKDHVDFLSVAAHKIYGPKGAGFFYQRQGVSLMPLVHGGGQEKDRRGGTENVAGIVGMGLAAKKICSATGEHERLGDLSRYFWAELAKLFPKAKLNGPKDFARRLPGLLNVTFPGVDAESLVHSLDSRGFAASSGAACAAGSAPPSHVLLAMGRSPKEAKEGLRLSFGRTTTKEQVGELLKALPEVVKGLGAMASFMDED